MNDKRNPNLNIGDGEDVRSYLERIGESISKLEWQSDGHRQWYTHRNPYSCWICEILQVARQLEALLLDESGDQGTDSEESDDG